MNVISLPKTQLSFDGKNDSPVETCLERCQIKHPHWGSVYKTGGEMFNRLMITSHLYFGITCINQNVHAKISVE